MPLFNVSYSITTDYEVEVEAASEDEVWQMIDLEHPDNVSILELDADEVNVTVDGSSFNIQALDSI